MEKVPMTDKGFSKLEEELKRLKTVDRPEIIRAIAAAREHGDISENAEYHAAKDRQAFVEARVREIEDKPAREVSIRAMLESQITGPEGRTGSIFGQEFDLTLNILGGDEASRLGTLKDFSHFSIGIKYSF